MKYKILSFITICLLSCSVYAQEKEDSIQTDLPVSVSLPDSIVRKLEDNTTRIQSLNNENMALKGLLKASQKETAQKEQEIVKLQHRIDDLQNLTIKKLEAANDTLQRRLVSMASNFLYIPYEEYSIEEIAVPSFLSTIGTPAFSKYQNRLPLLQNYKDDVSFLINFLEQAEKDLRIPLTKLREVKAKEYISALLTSPLYTRYTSYDDWENTYLGIKICLIQGLLKAPTEKTADNLKDINTQLNGLLNQN